MSDDGSDGDDKRTEVSTQNTMRERAGESRLKLWLLLSANRFATTALLAAFVFVGFLVFAAGVHPSLQAALEEADTVEALFTTMISVVVTGTTLVVTISQLVLSQENGPLGDQRRRMSDAMDFRSYSNELFGQAPPSDPSTFLRGLVGETAQRAELLGWVVDRRGDDDDLTRQVDAFVESIRGNATTVSDELDGAKFGTYDVVGAALDFNYAWKIHQIERLTDEFASTLEGDERAAFDDLQDALAMFGPAREHIKTLYFQWALVDISQYILYAAVPALIVAGGMATFVGGASFGGTLLGLSTVTWVTAVAFTISLVPFLLFTSYILRIVTIAKRTLAIGPFILRDSQR